VSCPGCTAPPDPDGLGIDDSRGRRWHGDCARARLARVRRDVIGACPGCLQFIGERIGMQDDRRRTWHFDGDGRDCVASALGEP